MCIRDRDDMLNGDGLRVVLWVSGCVHCCKECHNPITWDPNGGLESVSYTHLDVYKRQAWRRTFWICRNDYGSADLCCLVLYCANVYQPKVGAQKTSNII